MPASDCRLYLITPPAIADLAVFGHAMAQALEAGDVGAVQLRLKDVGDDLIEAAARVLRPMTAARNVALIMNDRPDLAASLGCDGVHIGQDDAPYAEARRLLGRERIVGVTCHDSRHLAMEAAEAGADYVAFGAFFPTTTKDAVHRPTPDLIAWWAEMMTVPCVAIGGITPQNCAPLVAAGADFLAVVGAVWSHPDGPAHAVKDFLRAIEAAAAAAD